MQVVFRKQGKTLDTQEKITILQAMQQLGIHTDAPCGGNGKCGKCKVLADGREVLACQCEIADGMVIETFQEQKTVVLQSGQTEKLEMAPILNAPFHIAIDIGTTTVCCQIIHGETGAVLASRGALNQQVSFGGDVVSRIQAAQNGAREALTETIRRQLAAMIAELLEEVGASPAEIGLIGFVGNTCMQQLLLGMDVENLVQPPFRIKLDSAELRPADAFFPEQVHGKLMVVPDISGYVGGDTAGCVLATQMYQKSEVCLMVDIGTNGEMVLGNKDRMVSCATAAGPALEGAGIRFGMRGSAGAIDRVSLENGRVCVHVIGEETAKGICGSGLIDAVALLWREGVINKRGRIQSAADCPRFAENLKEVDDERAFWLTDTIFLCQEDIRQVQMAKGAIAAGIDLMMQQMEISAPEIAHVYLAGAFGSFICGESACAIGLLPPALLPKIQVVGNAALEGCRRMVCSKTEFLYSEPMTQRIEPLELSTLPTFSRCFAKHMGF